MYFQTLTNCVSVKTVPFELEITYSDSDFSLASLRQATRHLGIGTSRFAAGVFKSVLTTGSPPSTCHARLTEMYGVFSSRNTQSHFNPRISSLRNPAYKPILRKHTVVAHECYPAKWQSVHPSKLRAVSQAFLLLRKSFWMDSL